MSFYCEIETIDKEICECTVILSLMVVVVVVLVVEVVVVVDVVVVVVVVCVCVCVCVCFMYFGVAVLGLFMPCVFLDVIFLLAQSVGLDTLIDYCLNLLLSWKFLFSLAMVIESCIGYSSLGWFL